MTTVGSVTLTLGNAPMGGLRAFADPKWKFLLGPQTIPGVYSATGVSNMETNLTSRIDEFVTNCTSLPGFVVGPGTITVTNGSSAVTGSGTDFLSRVSTWGGFIKFPDPSTPTGWGYARIVSASSNTSGTLGGPAGGDTAAQTYTGASRSGVAVYYANPATDGNGLDPAAFHTNYNYYDTVFALYQAWAKLDDMAPGSTILSKARQVVDALIDTAQLGGLVLPERGFDTNPRNAGFVGLACRAYDTGRADYWDTLLRHANHHIYWLERERAGEQFGNSDHVYDVREGGYALIFSAVLAVMHPNATVRATHRDRAIAWCLDPMIRKFDRTAVGGLRWFMRARGGSENVLVAANEVDGVSWTQPFIHALMLEGFVWTHRMMRYHGMTGDARYADIGLAIQQAATGWWSSYMRADNGYANYRRQSYLTGMAGNKIGPALGAPPYTPLVTLTPPGSPFAISNHGSSWQDIVEGRQLNATGMANLAYAYAVSGDATWKTRCEEVLASCFEYQANIGIPTYGSLWYSGHSQRNWNQHHRQGQKLTAWLHAGLESF